MPAPREDFLLLHFLVVGNQDRSREWYRDVFDADVLRERDPVMLRAANSWLILNEGCGPTDDKPDVSLSCHRTFGQGTGMLVELDGE